MPAYGDFVKLIPANGSNFHGKSCLHALPAAPLHVSIWLMKLVLAPMQDVTDLAFMRTLHRIGSLPDVFITAYFRSTPTTCALAEANLRCIDENETGVPILAQLAGSDASALLRDASKKEDMYRDMKRIRMYLDEYVAQK